MLEGYVTIKLIRHNGKIGFRRRFRNTITNAGRQLLIDRLQGAAAAVATYVAVGTGTVVTMLTDTALGAESARGLGTFSKPNAYTNRCVYTFAPGVATGTLREAGLFNAASAGTMFSRRLISPVIKGAADALEVTWDIGYPAGTGMLFSDSFSTNGPLDDPWVDFADLWHQDDGHCFNDDGGICLAVVDNVSFTNGYVQAHVYGSIEKGRVFLRWSQASPDYSLANAYSAQLEMNAVKLFRGTTLLAETPGTYGSGALLRLEAVGNTLTVRLDGNSVISYVDATPIATPGKTGIWADGDGLSWNIDDFECGTL